MKLLFFTDLHLDPDKTTAFHSFVTYDSLQACLDHAQAHHSDATGIILGGDLAMDGEPAAYAHLVEIMGLIFNGHDLISQNFGGLPVYPTMGNHDNVVQFKAALGLPGEEDYLSYIRTLAPDRHLVVIDTGAMEDGPMPALQLDMISQVAPTLKDWILVQHIQPKGMFARWIDRCGYGQVDQLPQAFAANPPKAIFIGHVHQDLDSEIGGVPAYTTRSTCFQFHPDWEVYRQGPLPEHGPGYRVIEWAFDLKTYTHEVLSPATA